MNLADLPKTSRAILERRIRKEVDAHPWNISYACQLACDYLFIKRGDLITERQAKGLYYSSIRGRTQLETIAQNGGVIQTKNIKRDNLNLSGTIPSKGVHSKYKSHGKEK